VEKRNGYRHGRIVITSDASRSSRTERKALSLETTIVAGLSDESRTDETDPRRYYYERFAIASRDRDLVPARSLDFPFLARYVIRCVASPRAVLKDAAIVHARAFRSAYDRARIFRP